MKKSRKFLSILIALSLTLMLLPATVFAADTHKVAIHRHGSGMGTADAEGVVSNKYYLVNYDGSLKSEDANEDNYNIYYDEASNHLTLNELYTSTEGMLLVPGGTTIEVIGFNMITPSDTSTGGGIGVISDGDLTITGSGRLWIESSTYSGISRTNPDNAYNGAPTTGNIQIEGSVQLTILHMGAASCISPNNGNVVIGGSAEVLLNPNAGTDRDNGSITNFNAGDITIQEDAMVTSDGSIDTPGKIKVDGSSELHIVPFEDSGVDLRGSGGVEVAKDAFLRVNSWTKSGQAIVAGDGTIKIAGETNVSMLNDSPAGNIALYAQSIEVTGKLIVRGGTNGLQAKGGNTVSFNGADVKLFDCMIGVASKAEITNSLLEFDTKLKAFNSTTTANLSDDYAVFAGTDVNNAEFISRGSDGVESGVWGRAYVRTEEHTCTYDQQVESDNYLASAADCDSPATYYYSCVCGAKGTGTFTFGTENGHDWGAPVWNWSDDGKTATVTFTCQNDSTHTQSPKVTVTSEEKTPATCTEMGITTYTAEVTFNGQKYTSTKDVADIAKLSHTMKKTEKVEATCTTAGKEAYYTCEVCEKHFSDEEGNNEITKLEEYGILPATEHKAGTEWKHNETGHWNECMNNCGEKLNEAAHSYEWVIDKEATATEAGSKHEECSICGYEKAAVEIPAMGTTEPTDPPKPTDPDKEDPSEGTDNPQTGDSSHLLVWIVLVFLSGGAVLTLTLKGRKKTNP